MSPNLHFQAIYKLTSDDLWPWFVTFDHMNIWRFPYYTTKPSLVPIGLPLFKWGHFRIFSLSYNLTLDDLWPWYVTSDLMNIWRFPYYTNKPSLVPIGLQLFKWGQFRIFSLSYNLTLDDLWPWYVTFDLINKCGFPCCIYDSTLVEIHQSIRKLEPNVNPISQQTTGNNNRLQQQWTKRSLCVFPAKAGDTKMKKNKIKRVITTLKFLSIQNCLTFDKKKCKNIHANQFIHSAFTTCMV